MKRILVLSLSACLISLSGLSQVFDKAKLDAYFDTLSKHDRFMGSVAISRNKELIYAKSVGFTDIEQGLKTNKNSKYRIASISKTFTTVLVLKAIEEGKLDINQTIEQFFPTIDNAQKITIEHLLYHRSGIPDYIDNNWLNWNTQPKTEQEMIEMISKRGSGFEPDSQTDYTNSNFVLLGYILEKIYKKPYSDVLEEKILNPAGLKNTYFGKPINTKDNECNPYHYEDGWEKGTATDMSILAGAAGIVSTPVDLTLFCEALFNGKLVSINSLKQMETIKDEEEGLGMGLNQVSFYDKTGFSHIGGIDGFRSMFAYFPDSEISFAYAANGINHYAGNIDHTVMSAIFNQPFEIPEFKTYHVTDEDLDKYLGAYVNKETSQKFIFTKAKGKLILQEIYPLEAIEKDKFERAKAGFVIAFNPADKTMVLKFGEETHHFEKED